MKNSDHETDLEAAMLRDLESFFLEPGAGFSLIARQKSMIINGDEYCLDLLLFHRKLRRLVAVVLKPGKFNDADKEQMGLYLTWLDRYEKQAEENPPIGLILCAEASHGQVELLEMQEDGLGAAEFWTQLPPKEDLERRLHRALVEAHERITRRQLDNT
ncbi:MAG: PDDEXK nuclease domain-containing protein [Bacteroidia bacterium]